MVTQQLEGGVDQGRVRESRADISLRLRVGVTGHRELEDEGRVREALVEHLGYLREQFVRQQPTPVIFSVMTALAEGADRLVAHQAREMMGEEQVELEAVLPLTVDDYLSDFKKSGSREEFHQLLDGAASLVVLADGPKPQKPERDEAYEKGGHYIVDRCDLLVAVWNGEPSDKRGGTAQIVDYARRQDVPVLIVPAVRDQLRDDAPALDAGCPRLRAWAQAFEGIGEYNGIAVPERKLRKAEASVRAPLEGLDAGLIQSQLEEVTAWAIPHLARADAAALRYQARYGRFSRVIHLLALLAVIAVGLQNVFARNQPDWLVGEIVFMVALVVAVWWARSGRPHERWIGYRSLAEAFRAALFIALSGAGEVIDDVPEVDAMDRPWSQRAFTEAWRHRPRVAYLPEAAPQLHAFLTSGWIDSQIKYHSDAVDRYEHSRNRYARLISALAGVTILVAALHIFVARKPSGAAQWFELVAIVLPGVGAAITGLRDHAQHRVHEDRSRRTKIRLERLKRQFDSPATLESVRRMAIETHRVIVEENQDWWGVIEFQDIELVI